VIDVKEKGNQTPLSRFLLAFSFSALCMLIFFVWSEDIDYCLWIYGAWIRLHTGTPYQTTEQRTAANLIRFGLISSVVSVLGFLVAVDSVSDSLLTGRGEGVPHLVRLGVGLVYAIRRKDGDKQLHLSGGGAAHEISLILFISFLFGLRFLFSLLRIERSI
jgi:hypothetical protein